MVIGGTGSVEGSTSWYMVVLGQKRLVLDGTWWNLVTMELSHSIWRRKINGDTDRLTDRQGEYSAICLFKGWKIEGRDLQLDRMSKSETINNLQVSTIIVAGWSLICQMYSDESDFNESSFDPAVW